MSVESTVRELTRATYIGKDFNTYVTEITQFVKQEYGDATFNDFVSSDLGVMFIELVAFANSTLSFYLDLQSGESYLDTAKLRNSVVRLTRNIGFKMTGAVPAVADVEITQELPKDFDVEIPAGTQLTSTSGLIFETLTTVTFAKKKALTGTFTLTQGSTTVSSVGSQLQAEVSFGPNGENETVIKLQDSADSAYRRVISINDTTGDLIIESPFPDEVFSGGSPVVSTALNPMISGDVGPKLVSAREGQTSEELFLSNGRPNQSFVLQNLEQERMIADGSVEVAVNNAPFTEVTFITYVKEDIFEAQLASEPPLIRFGDGLAGNIPIENGDIVVRYFATSGSKGNTPSEQINNFRSPVVVNFQSVSDLFITQVTPAVGGSDFFSLTKAKALAPFVFKAQDRAVTEEDYTAFSNTFSDPEAGAVGKAKAIIVRSIDDDFILQNFLNDMEGLVASTLIDNIRNFWDSTVSGSCKVNLVEIGVLTVDAEGRYQPPSAALLQSLTDFLEEKKEATVDILAFDGSPFIIPVDLTIDVKREIGFTKSVVENSVVTNLITFMRTKNFGDSLRVGDLYQTVEGTDGVNFSRIIITSPTDPPPSPAEFDNGDLVVGKLQIIEPRNILVNFLD